MLYFQKRLKKVYFKKYFKYFKKEIKFKLFDKKNLEQFGDKIKKHTYSMHKLIKNLKIRKKRISIYGASGKGQALMQYCKIDNKLIDYVFDKSKLKQTRFTPGTNIKILDPKFIIRKKVDFLIILSWNIKKEIIRQENLFSKKGGKFIVPFPNPRILK